MSFRGQDELLSPPPAGRIHSEPVRPGIADCSPTGRVRLDGLARILQDAAYADVHDAGLAHLAAWVLRTTRLRIRRFPRFGEALRARTFCSGLGSMWAERRTDLIIAGEPEPLVRTAAIWVRLDPLTLRPAPFTEAELAVYGPPSGGRRVRARLHHPARPAGAAENPWRFRLAETDLADHVNNAAYWVPVEEVLLGGTEPERLTADMEFRHPAQPGFKQVARAGTMLWISDPADGQVHASACVEGLG